MGENEVGVKAQISFKELQAGHLFEDALFKVERYKCGRLQRRIRPIDTERWVRGTRGTHH